MRGLDKLFKFQDTFELASINANGSKAAAWKLNSNQIGTIIDIYSLLVFDSSDCDMAPKGLTYLPYESFRAHYPFPEKNEPGDPCYFTINQISGDTKIIFDRPIDRPHMIDALYSAFHPRLEKLEELVRIPYGYNDMVLEAVVIFYHMESADFATARALYEDYDKLTAEARELLAKQPDSLGYRKAKGAW